MYGFCVLCSSFCLEQDEVFIYAYSPHTISCSRQNPSHSLSLSLSFIPKRPLISLSLVVQFSWVHFKFM
ncbi:hypothetical protein L2E82_15884 [Cichorium intybus]|uniref:Uncharacterized protein n=1 Tax=Cichorium intybus TaxID=13427 RepID=A0ACB9F4M1_CICIN|nr:hypothetical protein L2E82_15884 [Cichorium intybus]